MRAIKDCRTPSDRARQWDRTPVPWCDRDWGFERMSEFWWQKKDSRSWAVISYRDEWTPNGIVGRWSRARKHSSVSRGWSRVLGRSWWRHTETTEYIVWSYQTTSIVSSRVSSGDGRDVADGILVTRHYDDMIMMTTMIAAGKECRSVTSSMWDAYGCLCFRQTLRGDNEAITKQDSIFIIYIIYISVFRCRYRIEIPSPTQRVCCVLQNRSRCAHCITPQVKSPISNRTLPSTKPSRLAFPK